MIEYVRQELLKHGPVGQIDVDEAGNTLGWVSPGATKEQILAQQRAYDKLDKSPNAVAAFNAVNNRTLAKQALLTQKGFEFLGTRASDMAIWTALNDVREHVGLPRLNQMQIVEFTQQILDSGYADPIKLEANDELSK